MGIRQRLANAISPRAALHAGVSGPHLYAIGSGGIQEINPTRSTGNPLTDWFHGITDGDQALTDTAQGYANAYKASVWAFKCVRTRARTLSAIPLRIENAAGDEVPHPMRDVLSRRNSRLMYYTESDMQVYGRAFWRFGMQGTRAWVRRMNPGTIEVVAGASGIEGYIQRLDGSTVGEWPAQQVAHFHDYDPENDLDGMSPMAMALRAVSVTLNISIFAEYYFKNGAMPEGILVSEAKIPNQADRERLLAEWHRQFGGAKNAHRTSLLDGGRITYQPITPPLKDLAMVELRDEERRDICAAFDVPLSIAQAADPALYAAKQDYANFHTLAILPELDLLLDTINTQIMPWFGMAATVEPDLNDVEALQEDRGEITARNAQGVAAGYLSLNTALEREGEDALGTDYMIIGGKLVPKKMLDAGDFDALQELGVLGQPPAASPFSFMGLPPIPKALPPQIIEQPPTRAQVEITVRADDAREAAQVRDAVLNDTLIRELDRWQRKVAKRGPDVPFSPDYLPPAMASWLRSDLLAWDGETARDQWIISAFERASRWVRQAGDDTATPAEFEAYWRGIGDLFDAVAGVFEDFFSQLPAKLAAALRESGQSAAEFDIGLFMSAQEPALIEALSGDGGPLVQVVLAGAARGNDLLQGAKHVKQDGLTIDWQIVDAYARDWAKEYAGTLVRGINDTTLTIFRDKISAWIEAGGSLEDLAKLIEGDLEGLDIPAGWSAGKIDWAVSRERARLIAQTETTAAFHEGAVTRWEQGDVAQKRFRTQNDVHVDDEICRKLNNAVTGLRDKWAHPNGKPYGIPAHPGCRCFASPVV